MEDDLDPGGTPMNHRLVPILMLALRLAGCPGQEEADPTCPELGGLDDGEVGATIDGAGWIALDGTFHWAGTSLQINTGQQDGWSLAVVAQKNINETPVLDAVDAASFPMEIRLRDGTQGGWALLYPDSGASYATHTTDGGHLWLTDYRDGAIFGCFSFEAEQEDDEESLLAVEDGVLRIVEFEM